MVKRTHGYRFKARRLLSKAPRERGRPGSSGGSSPGTIGLGINLS